MKKKIAIVGAGISGLTLAKALLLQNHEVTLFEQHFQVVGAGSGLTLWPNATYVLEKIGALEFCLQTARPLNELHVLDHLGRLLMLIPTEKFSSLAIAIHRRDLHNALSMGLPREMIKTSQAVTAVRETDRGVELICGSSQFGPYDLVVGADGLHSIVRSFVNGTSAKKKELLRYKGYLIWRGIADGDFLKPGQFLEIWGAGHRFGFLPIAEGRVCWYATANLASDWPGLKNAAMQREFLGQVFSGWTSPISELLRRTPDADIICNRAFDHRPARLWSRGKVVLIGDAVHPIAPNLGQGSCLGIEDAMVLSLVLDLPTSTENSLRIFEKLRRGRVNSISRSSNFIGLVGQIQNPILSRIRNEIASVIPGEWFTLSSRRIHAYQADQQVIK